MCPSSGETTVFMRHLIIVFLYGWLSGMQGDSTLHTRQLSIQNNKYQVSHKYSCFSWWWAHSRPKHVEKGNRHTKKNCAPSWLYLQDSCKYIYIYIYIYMYTISSSHWHTREKVMYEFDSQHHPSNTDPVLIWFLYLPIDISTVCNYGDSVMPPCCFDRTYV